MGVGELTSFWIKPPDPRAPLGFGVTARSRSEALAIIRAIGLALRWEQELADPRGEGNRETALKLVDFGHVDNWAKIHGHIVLGVACERGGRSA